MALYGDDDSNANIQIIQVLILLVLVYFFMVMSASTCSKVIVRVKNKLAIHIEVLIEKIFTSRSTCHAIKLKDANRNSISGYYHELQESLIALDN